MSGVVVIGFDAMDPGIATRLVGEGRMPVLGGLLAQSAWAPTRNPDGLVVGGVWPSFATTTWPGRHGFYCFRQFRSGSYLIGRRTPHDLVGEPFWETLSAAGRRCCVVDAPLSRPSPQIDGVHVVDWGTHDRMLTPSVWPASEEATTVGRYGIHPVEGKCDDHTHRGDLVGLHDALVRGAGTKTDLSLDLLGREEWDLFITVYSESHCAGHQFWALHDAAWPGHDARLRAELGDLLEATYESLDNELGRVLAGIGDDATVMLLLSHGVGPHYDGDHLFAEIVRRLDLASGPASSGRRVAEVARRRLGRLGRNLARRARPGDRRLVGLSSVDGARRLFPVPNNELYGAVRLNLAGREPRGRVSAEEQEELLEWVSERLLELVDADDGRPLVQRVLRTDHLYDGDRRDDLPDLFVDWRRELPVTSAASPAIGVVRGTYDGIRSGDHRPTGLVAVRARGVAPGPSADPVDVVDLAPTVAAYLGVSLPGVDGRPAPALLPAPAAPAQR